MNEPKAKPLTTAQRAALDKIVELYDKHNFADRYRVLMVPSVGIATINRLVQSGLAERWSAGDFFTPTDAGRAALKEASE